MNSSFWQNVTGSVEENEEYLQAALREAQEETALNADNVKNIILTNLDFEFKSQWGDQVIEKVFIIECNKYWDVKIDPKEHCDFSWVSENDITQSSVHFESNYKALTEAIKL